MNSHFSRLQTLKASYRKYLNLSCRSPATLDPTFKKDPQIYLIKGYLPKDQKSKILYWASKPDQGQDPYPNPYDAYYRTPNKGIITTRNGYFQLAVKFPKSYWENPQKYQPPHVHIKVCRTGEIHTIELEDPNWFSILVQQHWKTWIIILLIMVLVLRNI